MAHLSEHPETCTDPCEAKHRCFYCGHMTSQGPVLATWRDESGALAFPEERLYPSCCGSCAAKGLWHDVLVADVSVEILAEARSLPICPLAATADHPCSTRAAMIQWAFDVIATERGFSREGSS